MDLHLSGKPCLSRDRSRNGSAGLALVAVACCLLLMLPLGLEACRRLMTWCLVRRSHQMLQQVLASAPLVVDPASLSRGNVQVLPLTARRQLTQVFDDGLPPVLQDRLVLQQVQVLEEPLVQDPDHWMGDRQPRVRPLVVLTARLEGTTGEPILIRQGVELILD